MLLRRLGGYSALVLLAAVPQLAAPPASHAGGFGIFRKRQEEPKPPVVMLAEQIDELEESLNETGTIVAKKPDVWGESRMTKHRREVEDELVKNLDAFEMLLNASVSRSDQAYFANAIAIQAALSPGMPVPSFTAGGYDVGDKFVVQNATGVIPGTIVSETLEDGTVTGRTIKTDSIVSGTEPGKSEVKVQVNTSGNFGFDSASISLEPTIQLDQLKRYLDHLNELRRLNEGGDTSDAPGYALNLVRIPVSVLPGDETRIGHGAEITVTAETHLTPELLPKAFRTLVIQDLVDQLALPVLKIAEAEAWSKGPDPEEVAKSRLSKAHLEQAKQKADQLAKEIGNASKEMKPSPKTISNLIALAQEVHCHLVAAASLRPNKGIETPIAVLDCGIKRLQDALASANSRDENARKVSERRDSKGPGSEAADEAGEAQEANTPQEGIEAESENGTQTDEAKETPSLPPLPKQSNDSNSSETDSSSTPKAGIRGRKLQAYIERLTKSPDEELREKGRLLEKQDKPIQEEQLRKQVIELELEAELLDRIAKQNNQAAKTILIAQAQELSGISNSLSDFVATIENVIGGIANQLASLNEAVSGTLASLPHSSSSPRVARYAIPPSQLVNVFGEDELRKIAESFDQFRAKECAGRGIHLSDARAFLAEELQAAYDFLLSPTGVNYWVCAPPLGQAVRGGEISFEDRFNVTCGGQTVTRSLAWAVLVESALLNDRLNEDMQRVSGDPDCNCMYGGPYLFLGPEPSLEARHAFMDYVRCRWPIQVFALDPVNQEQNIADAFSMRRELQLAAAIALATGQAGFSQTMRFARRIEMEQQTIDLNRTAVAFAHGASTFGWRFFPRFQTAEIESNGAVLFRDLLIGGPQRDHLIRDYRIEPGMRECVALVVMPSFVPHVRFDIRSNWFELHDPEDTESSMAETVELSRKIRDMQRLSEVCAIEADSYRPGETDRLLARVKQLSDKMPLQTVYAQVPYENTTGGFELFSSGVTDLSPELIDFYGAPGVNLDSETQLFLVGKNFSVHETEVIVGNRKCCTTLLSRDVMRVDIPSGVQPIVCRRPEASKNGPCAACQPGLPCGPDCYEAVEVHLATPYGVSGKLLIPAVRTEVAAAEAAAAVNAAIADHEALFHPVTFGWASDEVGGCVCYDEQSHILNHFCLQNEVIIRPTNLGSPFGLEECPLNFAANIYVEINGKLERIGTTNAISLAYDKGLKGWPIATKGCVGGPIGRNETCAFIQCVHDIVLGSSLAYGAKELIVTGFVQYPQCTSGVRLTKDLVISLEPCQNNSCLPSQNCPSCLSLTGVNHSIVAPKRASDATPVLYQAEMAPLPLEKIAAPTAGVKSLVEDPGFVEAPPLGAADAVGRDTVPGSPASISASATNVDAERVFLASPVAIAALPPTIVIQNEQPPVAVPVASPVRKHRGILSRLFHHSH